MILLPSGISIVCLCSSPFYSTFKILFLQYCSMGQCKSFKVNLPNGMLISSAIYAGFTITQPPKPHAFYNAFQWAKVPFPAGGMDPHLIVVPWSHLSLHPKQHLDWFNPFSGAYSHEPYTHRQTDRQTMSHHDICSSSRPHLVSAATGIQELTSCRYCTCELLPGILYFYYISCCTVKCLQIVLCCMFSIRS